MVDLFHMQDRSLQFQLCIVFHYCNTTNLPNHLQHKFKYFIDLSMNGYFCVRKLYLDMNLVPQSMYRICSYSDMVNWHIVCLEIHLGLPFEVLMSLNHQILVLPSQQQSHNCFPKSCH